MCGDGFQMMLCCWSICFSSFVVCFDLYSGGVCVFSLSVRLKSGRGHEGVVHKRWAFFGVHVCGRLGAKYAAETGACSSKQVSGSIRCP